MNGSRLVPYAPLSGVVFAVLAVAGAITMGESPDFVAEPVEYTTWFTDDKDQIVVGGLLMCGSTFFLLWFLGSLHSASARAEGGDGRLSSIARGGGLVGTALLLAGASTNVLGALRVDERGDIADEVAAVYGDLGTSLGFLAGPFAFAALLAATALAVFRYGGFLPAWLGWVSAVFAVGLLVPLLSWMFVLLLPLWVLVTALVLYVRGPKAASGEAGA